MEKKIMGEKTVEKKTIGKKLFIAMFIVMVCLPMLFWAAVGKHLAGTNYENRTLAEKPEFHLEEYEQYPKAYEAYLNDTLPFRDQLIQLNSRINYYAFRKASNENVIVGKEGWLFYDGEDDGDPIACYRGTNLFSGEELETIEKNLTDTKAYLEERDVEFVLMIAPNKERMYPEMMPDYYGEPAEQYAALQLIDYLREHTDIRIVYPYEKLLEAKKELPDIALYHKTDTHWNNAGAYVACTALLGELQVDMPPLGDDRILMREIPNVSSDLADMLHMKRDLAQKEMNYAISGYDDHQVVNDKWDFGTEFIYHSEGADQRKLFVCRDSFCSAMSGVLGSQFQESYMIYNHIYTNAAFLEQEPDIFVLETAERYLRDLLAFDVEKEKE